MLVVIDPGHGGWDWGATAIDGGLEKHFNLALGLALADALRGHGVAVELTRATDASLAPTGFLAQELGKRAALANSLQADMLVSLHHDSAGPQARGASLYVWTNKRDPETGDLAWLPAEDNHEDAPRSYALAQLLAPQLKEYLASAGIPWRGVYAADFQVLRDCKGPAVLLECFMGSNRDDVAAARKQGFISGLADVLAREIADALGATGWDPRAELQRLRDAGIIDSDHDPNAPVNWGQLATIINRLRHG